MENSGERKLPKIETDQLGVDSMMEDSLMIEQQKKNFLIRELDDLAYQIRVIRNQKEEAGESESLALDPTYMELSEKKRQFQRHYDQAVLSSAEQYKIKDRPMPNGKDLENPNPILHN